jgi:drug/metabolite transporter (DMT)-like permease
MARSISTSVDVVAPRQVAPWRWMPRIGLAVATLLWAGNFIAGRALRDEIGPLELNVWRWSIALAVLLPFTAGALWRQRALLRRRAGSVLALGLTGVAVPHACVYAALQNTSAVNALLLMSLTPLLIMLGTRVFFGQPISAWQWSGVALSLAGAVTLIARGSTDPLRALEFGSGDAWMVPAIIAAAAQALLLKRAPAGLAQAPLLAASIIAALALMLPGAAIFGNLGWPSGTRTIVSLGYVGALASAAAFLMWNHGVARVGPDGAAPFLFLMPMYGSVLSYAILGEPVRGFQYLGGALVLLGLWLARNRTAVR